LFRRDCDFNLHDIYGPQTVMYAKQSSFKWEQSPTALVLCLIEREALRKPCQP